MQGIELLEESSEIEGKLGPAAEKRDWLILPKYSLHFDPDTGAVSY